MNQSGPLQAVYPVLAGIMPGGRTPNYEGMFLRGLGGESAALGTTQGDAIRNITGDWPAVFTMEYPNRQATGAARWHNSINYYVTLHGNRDNQGGLSFDASRVVPTAAENRPVNQAVRYLIRALP